MLGCQRRPARRRQLPAIVRRLAMLTSRKMICQSTPENLDRCRIGRGKYSLKQAQEPR